MINSRDMITFSITMDRLSPFFRNFTLSARVFYSGTLCGFSSDHTTETAGHLHVLRSGILSVEQADGQALTIDRPSILFYPKPYRHRFHTDEEKGAEIVCAAIEFGMEMRNPLAQALPPCLIVSLDAVKELSPVADLLFTEAFEDHPGRQTAVDRLAEYFVVLLLRAALQQKLLADGVLMGLADPRLANAINAMHERPEHPWSLDSLAQTAGMSRARFAVLFRQVVGMTPFEYLTDWRIGLAQTLLRKGKPLKIVAPSVGYLNPTAFSRVFSQRVGRSPAEWLLPDRSTKLPVGKAPLKRSHHA
jgi:AraC-like DNA-binding protein